MAVVIGIDFGLILDQAKMVVEIIAYKTLKNNLLTKIRSTFLIFVIFITPLFVSSQCNKKVSAFIYSKNGKPLQYATIFSTQCNKGTFSTSNGNFTINHCHNDTLIIRFIGYSQKIVSIDDINDNDIITLERNNISIPEVNISPSKYSSKWVKSNGSKHGGYSSAVGKTFAAHINKHTGSFLEEITFYFQTSIEDSLFKLIVIPFSEDLSNEVSLIDSTIFISQNNLFSKNASINLSSLNIKIPKKGLLVGLEKVRLNQKVITFQLIDSNDYSTWVGSWGQKWYNYSASPLVKANMIGSTMKIKYKILIPEKN